MLLLVFLQLYLLKQVISQYIGDPGWSYLSSTWNHYYSLPLTESEAIQNNWTKILGCGNKTSPGNVYSKDNDLSTLPFYNLNGLVSGVILGILNPGASSEKNPYNKYEIVNATTNITFWGIEAHYRNPATTCASSQNSSTMIIGDRLWFRIFNSTSTNYLKIPLTQNETAFEMGSWTIGGCFPYMGLHIWRYISKDMDCDTAFPIFLLYNNEYKLNAWGMTMVHSDRPNLTSYRWEHPTGPVLHYFFKSVNDTPTCVQELGTINSQHIYMTSHPGYNNCTYAATSSATFQHQSFFLLSILWFVSLLRI